MANLLDEASILLTATAYDNGSMLAVKPENGDGDFTFSRNSAATRVNAEGLVENVQILSSNLVVNGDFANDSVWAKDANWSIANGKATSTGVGRMYQSIPFLETNVGSTVVVSFDIVDYTSGSTIIQCYGGVQGVFTGVGTHTFTTVTTNTLNFYINNSGQGNMVGSIDNVSVKVITHDTNLPRINYEDGCGSWLLEPQSTNSIPNSEDFGVSDWIKSRSLVSSNVVTSPSGMVDADKFIGSSVSGDKKISDSISVVSGNKYTFSVFAKKAEFDGLALRLNTAAFPSGYVLFNLDNGVGTAIGIVDDFLSEDYGNGWWRLSATSTADTTLNCALELLLANSGAITNVGNDVDGVYIWGAQAEQQSFATSYIPTQGAAATRLKDVANSSGNASLINSEEGVLYAETKAFVHNGNITLSDGSNSNNLLIGFNLNSGRIDCNMKVGGAYQFIFNYTTDMSINNKIAVRYKANDFALFVNGIKVLTDTSGITPAANTFDRLNFSSANTVANYFYGENKALAIYKTALTDEQSTALTTI